MLTRVRNGDIVAIAISLPWALGLYFVQGWFYPWLLPFFVTPFKAWIMALVIYAGSGYVGVTIARHRSGDANMFGALLQHALWYPINLVTLSSLSLHLSGTTLSYLFSLRVSFGVTSKDDANNHFMVEAPAVLRQFWATGLCALAAIAVVGVLATDAVPIGWQITEWTIMTPALALSIGAVLAPIILNPALIRFSF